VSLVVFALAVLLWFWFIFWECGVLFRFASAQPSTPPGTSVMAATSKRQKGLNLTSPPVLVSAYETPIGFLPVRPVKTKSVIQKRITTAAQAPKAKRNCARACSAGLH
jgi:hypothetical protein